MSSTEYGLVIIKDYEHGQTFDRLLVPADKVEEVYNIIQDHDDNREDENGNYIDWDYNDIFTKIEKAGIPYQKINNIKIYEL